MRSPGAVCVVGLGKIGLPLAVQYASRGFTVVGADIDADVVDATNRGSVAHQGETDLDARLSAAVVAGRLSASTDVVAAARQCSTVVIVVPLIVDDRGHPDFAILDAATAAVGDGITPDTLVVYETTLPVFTTRRRFVPQLEAQSGLRLGESLHVAFSPERVYVGRVFQDLRRYPKLVGGVDAASSQRAVEFYEQALEFDERSDLGRPNGVWDLGSSEAAELAKLAETTYRDINIGFANELAIFAERAGVDVFQVIDAANSQPFSHVHQPGVAVGGHCIPVYPRLLLSNAPGARIPAAAREANEAMPGHCVERLEETLGGLSRKKVAVLGLAYRGGVKETAFSGAFPLVEAIAAAGGEAVVHDPLFTDEEIAQYGLRPFSLGERCDAVIIQADHRDYATLSPVDVPGAAAVLDGRRISDARVWAKADVAYLQVGVAN